MAGQDNFAAMFETSSLAGPKRGAPSLQAGQRVEGTVLAISAGLVVVDIGGAADASLDLGEFEGRPVAVGDRITATVKNARRDAPELTLSLGRGGAQVSTAALQTARESGLPVSGTVTAAVKGGFSVEVAGTRAFCPISQMDLQFVKEPEIFVGQTFDFRITEIKEGGRNVIVSRRALLELQQKQAQAEVLAKLEVGATVTGTVKSTVKVGVVVDLGGLDGFIHISELSRSRVNSAEDVVQVGESVEVKVLSVEQSEKGLNVRLSLKALAAPAAAPTAEVEEILTGKVSAHVGGGILVATDKGEGLVPARELSLAPGADPRRTYPVGQELRVVVVHRDAQNGKLRFSVARVAQVEERANYRDFGKAAAKSGGMGSLGDLLGDKLRAATQNKKK